MLKLLGIAGTAGLAGCVSTSGSSGNSAQSSGNNSSNGNSSGSSGGTNQSSSGSTGEMASSASGWGWDIAGEALKGAAKSYNKKKDADVSVKKLGKSTWQQRFQTSLTSGSGAPDFSSIQNTDVAKYGSTDGLMELTDRIEEAGVREDIVKAKWSAVDYNGSDYAIPWDIGPTGVYYKRDVYEKAGINPDEIKTWDDFIEAGKKLPDGVAMFNLKTQDMSSLWRMLYRQLGGQPFTKDGAVNIHSEKSVRAAKLFKKMKDAGITTRIKGWSSAWFTAFAEGSLASLPSAAWMDGTLRAELPETSGNWGVYKLPAFEQGGTRASNLGGSNVAIPAQIEDEAVVNRAWDYCLWAMTTPEAQNRMLKEFGLFPSLTTAYDADIYDKELDFYDGQPVFGLFAEVAPKIKPYRYTTDTPAVQEAIESELGRMLDGKKSPEKAVQAAAETVVSRTDRDLA